MERIKTLIVDESNEFCDALAQLLEGTHRVRACPEGNQALQLLRGFQPDFLILDLMVRGRDGITLLQKMGQAGVRPVVLATTCYVSEYVLDCARRLGIGYLMVKPCDPAAVAARLADMTQRMKVPVFSGPDLRTQVSNMLLGLGFSTRLRGYGYLREAVLAMLEKPEQSITKELYPTVAVRCGVTTAQVERSIRSALQQACRSGERGIWKMYFPGGEDGCEWKMTNGAVITGLADRLRLSGRQGEGS